MGLARVPTTRTGDGRPTVLRGAPFRSVDRVEIHTDTAVRPPRFMAQKWRRPPCRTVFHGGSTADYIAGITRQSVSGCFA